MQMASTNIKYHIILTSTQHLKDERSLYNLIKVTWASASMSCPFCFATSWTSHAAAAAARSLQSCPTLCDPIEGSPPGSPVPGILQARTLEWVPISFSNAWKWKVKVKSLSRVRPSATPWTAAFQAPPSMGFSRQEYWSGVPLPSPGEALHSHKNKTRSWLWLRSWTPYCQIQTQIEESRENH